MVAVVAVVVVVAAGCNHAVEDFRACGLFREDEGGASLLVFVVCARVGVCVRVCARVCCWHCSNIFVAVVGKGFVQKCGNNIGDLKRLFSINFSVLADSLIMTVPELFAAKQAKVPAGRGR